MENRLEEKDILKNNIILTTTTDKQYNMLNNLMKPITLINAKAGCTYSIQCIFYKNILVFKCIRSGRVFVKYRKVKGKDLILLNGRGLLQIDPKATQEANKCLKE